MPVCYLMNAMMFQGITKKQLFQIKFMITVLLSPLLETLCLSETGPSTPKRCKSHTLMPSSHNFVLLELRISDGALGTLHNGNLCINNPKSFLV